MAGAAMSQSEQEQLWTAWRAGQSMSAIGRQLNQRPSRIFVYLKRHGGIQPARRCRRTNALSLSEREEISRGLASGLSLRMIASGLGRSPSTVSREVKRNGGQGRYRATAADRTAWAKALRPKICSLGKNPELSRIVSDKLEQCWSPAQIAGWLRRSFPEDGRMQVSHETIYKSLYLQTRGALRQELSDFLRRRRKFRHARTYTTKSSTRGQIVEGISIAERPAEIEDRAVPGHWEGDLISGPGNSHIATLVERHTRFVMLVKVDGKDTLSVVSALSRHMQHLPALLRQSLTWDRGGEIAAHKAFTMATDMPVYICDPHSPWQRGSNENTNGLLRQYFPKAMNLSPLTQEEMDKVAAELNQRPRKTLGFQSPAERLSELLH